LAVYLGFDCGTQSLNAIAIEVDGDERRILLDLSMQFDEALPQYGTRNGVYVGGDPREVSSSPRMWAEALDRLMGLVAITLGPALARLEAISGSGQQHGSVYLDAPASAVLRVLDPSLPLVPQLGGIFARERSPVWMDSSTTAECAEITEALGGADNVARLTGSRAFERFTGPQIRKFSRTEPDAYARTDRIHLVSSYLASLLLGAHAPIDTGDGAGMNLMDIVAGDWSDAALEATAPGLRAKLPPVVDSDSVIGRLAPYWTERYGFPPAAVVAWTGDNPSSLVGLGVVEPGTTAISLGTSDTLFSLMPALAVDPSGAAHVFGAPMGGYMGLVCFRNGSLARERVRDMYGLDWEGFSEALRATPPGNDGRMMLPWFEPEITPPVLEPGVRRAGGLDPDNAAANVRAVVEAQMLAMASHSAWAVPRVTRIHATGGAARNTDILQVMADVFDAPVTRIHAGNAACLGAAMRAFHASTRERGDERSWVDVVGGFAVPVPDLVIRPDPDRAERYARLRPTYAAFEHRSLHGQRPRGRSAETA